MPFAWNDAPTRGATPDRFREQHVRGIRQRARLLCNLKFSEADAIDRITRALRWEFDSDFATTPVPAFVDEVPALVSDVYAFARRGKDAPAKKKGVAKKKTGGKKKKKS